MNHPAQTTASTPSPVPGSRRGRPGRPRTGDTGIYGKQDHGHSLGTATPGPCANRGNGEGAAVQQTVVPVLPRLLDLPTAAAYLGVSAWTVRDLEAAGSVPRVRIPLPNAGELRKLLFDRADLDRLIDSWKDAR
jgi:hypothetical protein